MSDNDFDSKKMKKEFSLWKILLPVVIGIAVVAYMFYKDAQSQNLAEVFSNIRFTPHLILCIVAAWIFMLCRDVGLGWRFHMLTDKKMNWIQSFKVTYLCEFASCITPSAVGGSSMGMFFMNHEGIELGRATTLMITTLFLDELFFVVFCPIIVMLTPIEDLFMTVGDAFSYGIKLTFFIVYIGITLYTILLFLGIIVKPNGIRNALIALFSLKFLKKWQPKVIELGDNMVETSKELKRKKKSWWLHVFGGTALTWMSRYLVVNALFYGFVPEADAQQWIIFARQFIVWVVLMVSPTPGGSGLSEWLFTEFYANIISSAGLALILAIFWRIISYYAYLIIGSCLIPKWLGETYSRIKHIRQNGREE